jgi:hypothetical protein
MIRVKVKRPRGFNQMGRRAYEDLRGLVSTRLVAGLREMQSSILETPVYTGRTLVNFRWSLGGPITVTRAAIKDPPLPGKTSELPVGSEPRRAVNAAQVEQEFESLLGEIRRNPFQSIYLNNNLDHFSDVEYGTYAREGKTSRTPPGGMTRRGETLMEAALGGLVKRVA